MHTYTARTQIHASLEQMITSAVNSMTILMIVIKSSQMELIVECELVHTNHMVPG